jgi:murein hydrolase activator
MGKPNSVLMKPFKSHRQIVIAILVFTGVLLMMLPFRLISQDSKEKLQKSKKQLEDEIRYTTKLLEETHQSKQNSLNRVVLLNRQIERRQALIDAISKQVDSI